MREDSFEEFAQVVVDSLFRNGSQQEATRLLLVRDHEGYATVANGDYLGGLSKRAVTDRIINILRQREQSSTTRTTML